MRSAGPTHLSEILPGTRAQVFDAALAQAHSMNLEVKVIEKESGLLRFETVQLTPQQMDQYCVFPLEPTGCTVQPKSFVQAAKVSDSGFGILSITALVTSAGEDSSAVDVRANGTAHIWLPTDPMGLTRPYTTESKGILEKVFLEGVKQRLGS